MQETENIKLQKPSENEYINLQTLNDNADKVDAEFGKVENPPFDDTGMAEGINSFTDFINSVKNKMNIFQFYRDFKAGMKYVLHAGRLANNAVTTEEGFALDARMGKILQDQITEQNKNIHSKIGGGLDHTFIQLQDGLNVTRLQIEVGDNAKIYKSTDGGSSFPTVKQLVTNNDLQAKQITLELSIQLTRGYILLIKSGNIVQVYIDIVPAEEVGSYQSLAYIPEEYRTLHSWLGSCVQSDNGMSVPLFLSSDGTFRTTYPLGLSAGKNYFGSGCYVCK